MLALSEVAACSASRYAPMLPPWGTGAGRRGAAAGSACGSPTRSASQLRYGRGLDNRKLKQAGYRFGCTSRETVLRPAEALRPARCGASGGAPYRYEREVEEFLRWTPSVRAKGTA